MDKRGKFLKKLGDRIQDCLYDKGMKQADLIKKTKIPSPTLSGYINNGGNEPSASKIAAIARALDTTSDYLLDLTTSSARNNPDLGSACDYTGLSEKAVKRLRAMTHSRFSEDFKNVLNGIIENDDFYEFVAELIGVIKSMGKLRELSQPMKPPLSLDEITDKHRRMKDKVKANEFFCMEAGRKIMVSVIEKAMNEAP